MRMFMITKFERVAGPSCVDPKHVDKVEFHDIHLPLLCVSKTEVLCETEVLLYSFSIFLGLDIPSSLLLSRNRILVFIVANEVLLAAVVLSSYFK